MTIDEAIKHCEETAHQNEILMKRYDDASGYSRSHNEQIRTSGAIGCESLVNTYRQLAKWLRELKEYKDARVGCEYCKHNYREQHERPCSLCQRNFEEAIDYIEKWKTDYSVDAKDREVLSMAIKALEIVNDFETAQIITGGRLNGRTYAYKCGLADGQRLAKDEKILEQQPSEDCISRQAVLDIINFEDEWLHDANSHNADTKIVFSGLESRVKALPSVTPKGVTITDFADKCQECGKILNDKLQQKWIPVSERLPEDFGGDYLINIEYKGEHEGIDLATYIPGGYIDGLWNTECDWIEGPSEYWHVTAWMPLPEPYKAESEDKE